MKATKRHNNKYSTKFSYFVGKVRVREIIAQGLPHFKEYTVKDLVFFILVLLITIALSLFILNQFLELKFKQELLLTPCELCKEINKQNIDIINWSNITILSSPSSPTSLASLEFDPT